MLNTCCIWFARMLGAACLLLYLVCACCYILLFAYYSFFAVSLWPVLCSDDINFWRVLARSRAVDLLYDLPYRRLYRQFRPQSTRIFRSQPVYCHFLSYSSPLRVAPYIRLHPSESATTLYTIDLNAEYRLIEKYSFACYRGRIHIAHIWNNR